MKLYTRREPARGRVAQHHVEPALGLAGEHGRRPCPGRRRDRPRGRPASRGTPNVEAAHGDRDAGRRGTAARCRARGDTGSTERRPAPTSPKSPWRRKRASSAGMSTRVFVSSIAVDIDGDVRPEHLPLGAIGGNAIHGGERIRGDHRAPPADHIAVVVVMRRLDQNELEAPGCAGRQAIPLVWRTTKRSFVIGRQAQVVGGTLRLIGP